MFDYCKTVVGHKNVPAGFTFKDRDHFSHLQNLVRFKSKEPSLWREIKERVGDDNFGDLRIKMGLRRWADGNYSFDVFGGKRELGR